MSVHTLETGQDFDVYSLWFQMGEDAVGVRTHRAGKELPRPELVTSRNMTDAEIGRIVRESLEAGKIEA